MPAPIELHTPRLLLRRWRGEDRAAFAALNGDPEVMRHFPACLGREESDRLAERIEADFACHGFGFWALERKDNGAFIGFTGLRPVAFDAPFCPAVEIAWRLARPYWRQGLASEAARAALSCGFGPLGLEQIVSFTAVENLASQGVMRAIGMQHEPAQDFAHPALPVGHRLSRHLLYRLTRADWEAGR
ncbi:GNAT family N-acetyltransferase [Pseudomonas sp. CrR25]|nr:GNAT family N-acetyltransferase [Pseudomonas sp. CrR25]